MRDCVQQGLRHGGELPGGLRVRRRAPGLHARLLDASNADPLHGMDWVNMWALAVNEENAGGGRVVTAPTNGAAGIVPAVLHYYDRLVPGADNAGIETFLLAAAAVGGIIKRNASISGPEVGCQDEIGSACAMAAAGLAAGDEMPAAVERLLHDHRLRRNWTSSGCTAPESPRSACEMGRC
jgi:L-serine dehydratase